MACSCSELPPYWVGNLLAFAFQEVDCLLQMTGNIAQKAKQLQIFYITFAFQIKKKEAKKSYFKIVTGASCYLSGWCFTWSLGQSSVRIKLKPRPKLKPRFYIIESQEAPSSQYQRCSEAAILTFNGTGTAADAAGALSPLHRAAGHSRKALGDRSVWHLLTCSGPASTCSSLWAPHSSHSLCGSASQRSLWGLGEVWHHEILGEHCRQKYGKNLHSHQVSTGCPWAHTCEETELCYVCHHVQSMFWEHIWSTGQLKVFSF